MRTVILKFDDLRSESNTCPKWNAIFSYVISNNIKISVGIIGRWLRRHDEKLFNWIKFFASTGNIEFWNHGFSHNKKGENLFEFSGTTYEEQYHSIMLTQTLAKQRLGLRLSTFGAPWNQTDKNTTRALEKFPEINAWFAGDKSSKSAVALHIGSEIFECRNQNDKNFFTLDTFKISYELSLKNRPNLPYTVIQFHPSRWASENEIMEFYKIVDYLSECPDTEILTPSEYLNQNGHFRTLYI